MVAHFMFMAPLVDFSMKARTGGAQWFAEFVAAFGLVTTILAGIRFQRGAVPWPVDSTSRPPIGSRRRLRLPIQLLRLRAL
jgi:hypothetical protein